MPDTTSPLTASPSNGVDHSDQTAPGRADINRANAQHCTGPRTEDGKRRSSLNALRHGLTGQTIVLPSEDLAAYQRHTQRFSEDLQPKGVVEEQLVQALSDASWRLNRVAALENNLLSLAVFQPPPITTGHPEAQEAIALAQNLHEHTRTLATLSMHGQRLSRQFEQTLRLLREIQADRRYTEEWEQRTAEVRAKSENTVGSFSRPKAFTAASPSQPLASVDSSLSQPLASAESRPPRRTQEIRTR
jgi:hypothetical protein